MIRDADDESDFSLENLQFQRALEHFLAFLLDIMCKQVYTGD